MPGENVQIGPFIGGLNTFSDPTAIADNELTVCENFELDLDGSLVSRPPFVYRNIDFPLGVSGNVNVLGYYYGPGNVPYLLASNGLSSTYYFNGSAWVLITSTFSATAMVEFDNKAWLVAPESSANPGGYWSPSGGFTAVANMTKGDTIVAYKERLWIAKGRDATSYSTRVYYSNIFSSPTFWPTTPSFVDIGTGDGQSVVQLAVYYNSLIIFRTSSIYSLQYSTDPASATQSLLVPNIGLTNKKAMMLWENYIYFIFDDKAYEFINNRATQLNMKVPFTAASRSGIATTHAVSVFNNRVIFSFWDTLYVFSVRTRTWTTWKSTVWGPIGQIVSAIVDNEYDVSNGAERAIAFGSAAVPAGATRVAKTLHITDAITTDAEEFHCTAETKNFNYQASSVYKRLFWWGVDAIFRGEVVASAIPVTFSRAISWLELSTHPWTFVANYTWEQPLTETLSVETTRDTTGTSSLRKFVKFLKALRFRQIKFRVVFDTDGSINTAPVRLFSLMTYVRAHQRVSKTVT